MKYLATPAQITVTPDSNPRIAYVESIDCVLIFAAKTNGKGHERFLIEFPDGEIAFAHARDISLSR